MPMPIHPLSTAATVIDGRQRRTPTRHATTSTSASHYHPHSRPPACPPPLRPIPARTHVPKFSLRRRCGGGTCLTSQRGRAATQLRVKAGDAMGGDEWRGQREVV
ncbi:hypothetical protein B0H12DRAFT_1127235 [Mycena haematopus]|nr:hypothetical protein B0H12DRAFT_1127235 [Mycena haematopus]